MKSLQQLRMPKEIKPLEVEPQKGLVEAIDEHLSLRNQPNYKKISGFHPSYTNQCSRYWYYLFEGVSITPSFNPQTYRIFDNGHAVHERLYSYFREMGILIAEEISVSYSSPPIEGTADGIINWYGEKLIELKSISAEGFHYRQLHNKPKDEHYRQAQIYMECLNLDAGYVIYENKNNQQILPIYIKKDKDFIEKLFKKYRKIHGSYTSKEIPVQPYKITSANCGACDLKKHCWAEGAQSNEGGNEPF